MIKIIVMFFGIFMSALFAHAGEFVSFTIIDGFLHPIEGFTYVLIMLSVGFFTSIFAPKISLQFALLAVGLFTMFHSYMHVFAFSGNGSFISFIIGFSFSTLLIYITGLAAGLVIKRSLFLSQTVHFVK